MKLDRGEAQGTAAALLLHVALVVALTTSLARLPEVPEPPSVEVELVDSEEVALTAAAPTPAAAAAAAQAPAPAEPAPPQPNAAPTPAPPQPVVRPTPAPIVRPVPSPPRPAAQRPAPPSPPAARPAQPTPRATPPRTSRLGDDFLRGIPTGRDLGPRPAASGAATFSAAAKASVDSAIKRQIQPCAARQATLGPGADRIRVTVNLRLDRSGRLARPPALVRTSGVDEDNRRFEDLAYDQAVAVFRACSPLRLPADLYSTPQGGWGNINLTYGAK